MRIIELNHVAIHIADVDRSIAFYRDVMMLRQLPRPEFDFDGAWFELGDGRQLHLIAGRVLPAHSHNRGTHFALHVADFDEAEAHIQSSGAPHKPRQRRPDGAWQLFVTDPDGHIVELCDNTTADAAKRTKFP
ncbi:MAG: glyoxalase [Planctomycetes bacterium]|nr:glyoxalase [Planctomycetota bacterium]